jgi:hypothetical protein
MSAKLNAITKTEVDLKLRYIRFGYGSAMLDIPWNYPSWLCPHCASVPCIRLMLIGAVGHNSAAVSASQAIATAEHDLSCQSHDPPFSATTSLRDGVEMKL